MIETRTIANQVVVAQNSAQDDVSILSTRSNIRTTVTTQPITALQQDNQAPRTALAVSEAHITQNNNPNPPGRGGGGGRGGGRDRAGRGKGRGNGRRPSGILGACSNKDKRLTRYDDGRTTKKLWKSKLLPHTRMGQPH